MNEVAELFKRTEHLRTHIEALRDELEQLRGDLSRLQSLQRPPEAQERKEMSDCLAVAISLAEDLGQEFASERPHDLNDRGDGWLDAL